MENKGLVDFFYECGFLKRLSRSGWFYIGKENPESVAEHSYRTAVIGFFMAKEEWADPDKVLKICLFHDLHETRTGDLNKVNQRYINPEEPENSSFSDIIENLPDNEMRELSNYHDDFGSSSKEGIVSKDADYVECALQAKEYFDEGFKEAWSWIENISKVVKTETAKNLIEQLKNSSSKEWFKKLKQVDS